MRVSRLPAVAATAALALLGACATEPAPADRVGPAAAPEAGQSILEMSIPAAGSTVKGPVNELMLHFNPPARLDQVTVTGPEGTMPMMITPVGEVQHYALPLSDLGPGAYTVNWRATAQGTQHRGSFGFTVR